MDCNMDETNVDSTMPTPKRKKLSKVATCIIAIVCAIALFLGGAITAWFSLDKELRTLAKVKAAIDTQYYKEVTNEEFYQPIFNAINNEVLDPYSCYMSADELTVSESSMAGNRIGLGIVFATKDMQGKDQMLVTRVCGNSPAEEAGITAGDCVTGFGRTEDELTNSVVFNNFSNFLKEFSAGEAFYVRLTRNGVDRVVSVYQQSYVENYVFYRTNQAAYTFTGAEANVFTKRGEGLATLDDDTAYIRLIQFSGSAAENFATVMEQFKKDGKKNLVLDLRGNGGGYLETMQSISSYFCKSSKDLFPIVARADYGEFKTDFRATGNRYDKYFSEDSRICVLADVYTASASECLIGAMVDYGAVAYSDICIAQRGTYTRTYGKGIMQTTFPLGVDGGAVKLTTAEILWPSGHSIHARGVLLSDGAVSVAENLDEEAELLSAISLLFQK